MEILKGTRQNIFYGVYLTLLSVIGSVSIGLAVSQLHIHFNKFIHVYDFTLKEALLIVLSIASILTIVTVISAYFLVISYFYWET